MTSFLASGQTHSYPSEIERDREREGDIERKGDRGTGREGGKERGAPLALR